MGDGCTGSMTSEGRLWLCNLLEVQTTNFFEAVSETNETCGNVWIADAEQCTETNMEKLWIHEGG